MHQPLSIGALQIRPSHPRSRQTSRAARCVAIPLPRSPQAGEPIPDSTKNPAIRPLMTRTGPSSWDHRSASAPLAAARDYSWTPTMSTMPDDPLARRYHIDKQPTAERHRVGVRHRRVRLHSQQRLTRQRPPAECTVHVSQLRLSLLRQGRDELGELGATLDGVRRGHPAAREQLRSDSG
jgi:hypothetical protein